MSLAIAFCTHHGIVMGADRQITTTLKSGESFAASSTERKLFLAGNGYGFSYTGCSKILDVPVSYWMDEFVSQLKSLDLSVFDCLLILRTKFVSLSHSAKLVLIGAGCFKGKYQVASCNLSDAPLTDHLKEFDTCIAFSGENDLARKIIDAVPVDRDPYTVPDASAFVQHVILTVSNIQRFGQTPVTVSPECDVLYIGSRSSRWIKPPLFLE